MKKHITIFFIVFFAALNQNLAQTPPISPKWAFEPWVWEDTGNNEDSTLNLKNDYIERKIPVGAVIIDSPWEWPSVPGSNDSGYNTFKFEPSRFDDPTALINDSLYDKGIHVILWMTGNMTTDCPEYQYAHDNGYFIRKVSDHEIDTTYFWRGNGKASHIDFFNPDAVKYWESLMDRIFDNYEVDGWKVDESDFYVRDQIYTYDGTKTKKQYSDAYYTEMYTYIQTRRGNNGMIMARPYCGQVGDSPYWFAPISVNTAAWVGDQEHTWDGLQLALTNMFISADGGYATVGSDIGGGGYSGTSSQNKDLFIRWVQLGSLVPIMENGGKYNIQHQPWLFNDDNVIDIYRYFADLHHEMVPYLYSYDITANLTGTSIVRPFGSRSTTDTTVWIGDWNYMLGDNLFIAAIYQDNTSRILTFPQGSSWIDYWNDNNSYQGGETETLTYSLNKYPIFIRSGAIIPLNVDNSVTGHGTELSKDYLTLLIYPDGLSNYAYRIDPSTTTNITCNSHDDGFTISFSQNTGNVIIRLKNNIEPENVGLNGGVNLVKYNSFHDLEQVSSGWFQGKINDNENAYTWIKFSNPADTVYVTNSCSLDLYPANYELSNLNQGNTYYIDRTYTITSVPEEYEGFNMIKTANDDKGNTNLDFHFNICSNADIYIAYDHRLTVPSWMITDNYVNTGKTISVSDSYLEYFNVWKRTVQPGTVHFYNIGEGIDSSMYFVFYKTTESLSVSIKVFLQGPYNTASHNMNTNLRGLPGFPKTQPYGVAPWSYSGNETVTTVPSGVVDWVLVELRSTYNGSAVSRRAAFLKSDGTIFDTGGVATDHINFSGVPGGNYYIVIKYRNHLAVMSTDSISLPNSSVSAYDFTAGSDKYYGASAGAVQLESGVWGMISGDANGDGQVNASDRNATWNSRNQTGYLMEDVSLDGQVNASDRNTTWNNRNYTTQVP